MLADDRVVPMLPKLLGNDFFKSNKLPLPINVTKKDLRAEVERCGARPEPPPLRVARARASHRRLLASENHPVCAMRRCVGCAVLRPTQGTCSSVTVANAEQPAADVVENVIAAAEKIASRTPGEWSNVKALHLRSTNSVSLPIYNAV
jgi:ribosome biogenesis protein UTP30